MKKAMIIVAARPEIIKMPPVGELLKRRTYLHFIHRGQHYDYNMSQQFIEKLELP